MEPEGIVGNTGTVLLQAKSTLVEVKVQSPTSKLVPSDGLLVHVQGRAVAVMAGGWRHK